MEALIKSWGIMISRRGLLSYFVQVQNVALQLIISIFLAKLLGPESYGLYAFTFTIVSIFYILHGNLINNMTVRYGAKYLAEKKIRELKGLLVFGISLTVIYGILLSIMIYGGLTTANLEERGALRRGLLFVACLSIITFPLMSYVGSVLRVLDQGIIGQIPEYLIRPWVFIALALAAYLMTPVSLDVKDLLAYQSFAALIAFLMGVGFLYRKKEALDGGLGKKYYIQAWCKAAVPFLLMGGVMLVNTKADMVMLGLLSHPEIAGAYKVALSFAGVVGLSLTSGNLYLSPKVSALHETGMKNELQSLLNKFSTWTFFIALVASIVFLLAGEYTLEMLFGGDYSNSYRVLCILIIGQLINAFFGPVGMVLSMTGNQGFAARIAGVAAAINVLMNLIMIPKFGGEGAAVSTAITLFIWNSLMYRFVTKKLNVDPSIIWRLKPEALRLWSK